MNKKSIILLVFSIVILILAIFIYVILQSKKEQSNIEPSNPNTVEETIKEFSFCNEEKKYFNISDFFDKPIALVLWRSDSEHALETIELLNNVYENYKKDINFLVINTNEPDKNIIETIKECNFSLPIYYDINNTASEYYSYDNLPFFVFIDKNGEVSNQFEKDITEDKLTANLDIIAENY